MLIICIYFLLWVEFYAAAQKHYCSFILVTLSFNNCSSLCGSVTEWRPVQGVPCILPNAWDTHSFPVTLHRIKWIKQLNGWMFMLKPYDVTIFLTDLPTKTIVRASWVQDFRKQGCCSGSLLYWPFDGLSWRSLFRSGGQHHNTGTWWRADWKLIKNACVPWMMGSFCCSPALTEEAGQSCVPAAGEPLVASAIVSLPDSCLISSSISMRAADLFVQMVITTTIFLCIKPITSQCRAIVDIHAGFWEMNKEGLSLFCTRALDKISICTLETHVQFRRHPCNLFW